MKPLEPEVFLRSLKVLFFFSKEFTQSANMNCGTSIGREMDACAKSRDAAATKTAQVRR